MARIDTNYQRLGKRQRIDFLLDSTARNYPFQYWLQTSIPRTAIECISIALRSPFVIICGGNIRKQMHVRLNFKKVTIPRIQVKSLSNCVLICIFVVYLLFCGSANFLLMSLEFVFSMQVYSELFTQPSLV